MDGPLNPIPGVADLDECADPEMHDCPVGKIVIAKLFYSLVFYSYICDKISIFSTHFSNFVETKSDKRGREIGGSRCINRFGGFSCRCLPGWGDPYADDPERSGRYCQTCDAVEHCSGRGICRFGTESDDVENKNTDNIRCE